MSVIGFDIGNSSSTIGIARAGGIDIIANEYSYRLNPTLVGYAEKRRSLGETAKTQLNTNYKNTVQNIKCIIGRDAKDPFDTTISAELEALLCRHIINDRGSVEFLVKRGANEEQYSDVQVMAAFLYQLKTVAESELGRSVKDCVISVPNYFNDRQRQALLDASVIVGLNCLRLLNDTTAAALQYGIYKQDLPKPEEEPRMIAIVDCGHSSFKCSLVSLVQQKLTVLGSAYDDTLGGRQFDRILYEHYAEEFKDKYKIDVKSNPRATMRLLTECEKQKKVMSSNTNSVPLNIECLMNDKDVRSSMKRETYEGMCTDLLAKIEPMLQRLVATAGIDISKLHSVEVIGGMSRVPSIKSIIKGFFNKECNTTLNADEAVARGCTLSCAILSPSFRVREFVVTDVCPYGVTVEWTEANGKPVALEAFAPNSALGSQGVLKSVTVQRTDAFDVRARYTDAEVVANKQVQIASYKVPEISGLAKEGSTPKIKAKIRMNAHGIFVLESAAAVQEVEDDVAAAAPTPVAEGEAEKEVNGTDMKVDEPVKKKTVRTPIVVESTTSALTPELMTKYIEAENENQSNDKLVIATEHAKNRVEEYVYEVRDNLDGKWEKFVNPDNKEGFSSQLTAVEDWLYEDGEDVTKSVYDGKYEELFKVGQPIADRYIESEKRPESIQALRYAIVKYRKAFDEFTAGAEKYDHLEQDDMSKVNVAVTETDTWINELEVKQNNTPLYEAVVIRSAEVDSKANKLKLTCEPFISKPKPVVAPEVPHPDGGAPADIPHPDGAPAPTEGAPATEDAAAGDAPAAETAEGQATMEVD